jgi:hypothetical protein
MYHNARHLEHNTSTCHTATLRLPDSSRSSHPATHVEAHAHLLQVTLGLGLDGDLDDWVGEVHALQDDWGLLVAQGLAGHHVLWGAQAEVSREEHT